MRVLEREKPIGSVVDSERARRYWPGDVKVAIARDHTGFASLCDPPL